MWEAKKRRKFKNWKHVLHLEKNGGFENSNSYIFAVLEIAYVGV